ncbi:Tricorn protease interacting factor F2 [Thermoplasma acidophilum]|uniref:Tricorn protease-interacting factor F2 n=1 Tax=Thermoplasma acidophilum (strain ATCC 25905 / DSM 1728 / JCM 9062 / NBRC 15155 / AMRC-C165) TaxID=273075 RepID=TRF2_THEAC|nr:tricorn protease-interacting factor Trf2 [Thermoplasma acidophilum]O93654.1 RecName: Full=Tricorn protease-interacting factor F2 [Thermoplasma acidophilum DSM 1728]AAC98289.1 Tricorn protease interacting factor F2 [Thermoplasma acidophilum]CAC11446.1 Tricorn protease interacting factor F2 [Thermoplasma acidophilum]
MNPGIEKYEIRFDFDLKDFTYTSHERIHLAGDWKDIKLDAVRLSVDKVTCNGQPMRFETGQDTVTVKGSFHDKDVIDIDFHAKVSDTLMGLYLSRTKEGTMITTQFESNGARMAFPCVDHPAYKAVFAITVVIDKDYDAISNMPPKRIEVSERKIVEFQDTPKMSTYLLYIGVGKFKYATDKYRDIDLILVSLKDIKSKYPLEIARKSIEFYESYFGIPYALPKMHLISVPEFGAGAMENWGAITFREVALMATENSGSIMKQNAAITIAHEIAHQWFGDLVTMKWWNDLWLNESFATFMSYKTVDSFSKQWDVFADFIRSETGGALRSDSLKNTHPIEVDVKDPDEISQIFDEISYGKGASILRMIEDYAGYEEFRKGISKYLNDHRYGNAEGSDLWTAIEDVSGKPVKRVMEYWIKNPGYPVVSVVKSGNKFRLTQEQFFLDGTRGQGKWPIPLTVMTKSGKKAMLMEESAEIEDMVKVNVNSSGFYRVSYDGESFETVMKNYSKLSNLDRWGLISDLYAFLISGRVSVDDYLARIKGFFEDSDHLIVEEIASQLTGLYLLKPDSNRIRETAASYLSRQVVALGDKQKGEDDKISKIRGIVTQDLAMVDDHFASDLARKFSTLAEDPDLALAKSIAAAKAYGISELASAADKYTDDEIRVRIIAAMGWCSPSDLKSVFELIDKGTIRKQDMLYVFSNMPANPKGRDFFFSNIDRIVALMEHAFEGTGYTSRILETAIPYLGLARYEDVKKKAEQIRKPSYNVGINKGLETLEIVRKLYNKL